MQLAVGHQYSNLGPNLLRFRDIAGFLLRRAAPLLFDPSFRGVSIGLDCRCWSPMNQDRKLINHVFTFEVTKPIQPRYLNVTNRRTDGRTTYDSNILN